MYKVPWSCNLEIQCSDFLTKRPISNCAITATLVNQENWESLTPPQGNDLESFVSRIMDDDSIAAKLSKYKKQFDVIAQNAETAKDGTARFTGLDESFAVIQIFNPLYGESRRVLPLTAGKVHTVIFEPKPRLVLNAIILNELGEPMPGYRGAKLIAQLQENGGDLNWDSTEAGAGALGAELKDGTRIRTARLSCPSTDNDGRFSKALPLGTHYAIELKTKTNYLHFTFSKEDALRWQENDEILTLKLPDNALEPDIVFVGMKPECHRLILTSVIADDFPWFRQFPQISVSEKGEVYAPWLRTAQGGSFLSINLYADKTTNRPHRTWIVPNHDSSIWPMTLSYDESDGRYLRK
ncbi:MAG: hypothetical protein HN961_08060 [Planctomycetes bacterium]|jgi:hypothetical protein|nr:hypothetical protein [Planctomycetota bacterium]